MRFENLEIQERHAEISYNEKEKFWVLKAIAETYISMKTLKQFKNIEET